MNNTTIEKIEARKDGKSLATTKKTVQGNIYHVRIEYTNTEALQFEVFALNEVQAIKKAVKKYPLEVLNDSPINCVKILETVRRAIC